MKILINISSLLLVCVTLLACGACDTLSTRTPEDPNQANNSFIPPTSPELVIANFITAIKEKNVDNYASSFAATATDSAIGEAPQQAFRFEPSASAAAQFQSLFSDWDIQNERQAFVAIHATTPENMAPEIMLENEGFEVSLPDSSVFVGDYTYIPHHTVPAIADTFGGVLRFIIKPTSGGFWAISNWSDESLENVQSNRQTWSILKARFVN